MARGNLHFQRQPGSPYGKNAISRTLARRPLATVQPQMLAALARRLLVAVQLQ